MRPRFVHFSLYLFIAISKRWPCGRQRQPASESALLGFPGKLKQAGAFLGPLRFHFRMWDTRARVV